MTTTATGQLRELARLRRRLPPPALRRAIRESSGLSGSTVAKALGVSRQTVSHWECGVRTPRSPLLEAYVEILDELQKVSA